MLRNDSSETATGGLSEWCLTLDGRVERPASYDRDDLRSMEQVEATRDFSCVEGWSRSDLEWGGIPMSELLQRSQPTPDAKYALVHAFDEEYSCAFTLGRLADALLALRLDGSPLEPSDGGPARLVFRADESECWEGVKRVSRIDVRRHEPEDTAADIALSRIE